MSWEEKAAFRFFLHFPHELQGVAIFLCLSTSLPQPKRIFSCCCCCCRCCCHLLLLPVVSRGANIWPPDEEFLDFLCCLCFFFLPLEKSPSLWDLFELIFPFGCLLCERRTQRGWQRTRGKGPLLLYNFAKERAQRRRTAETTTRGRPGYPWKYAFVSAPTA